jgi:methionyl-tRNA formyltransferase
MSHGTLLCLATKKGYSVLRACEQRLADRPLFVCTFDEPGVEKSYGSQISDLSRTIGVPVVQWSEFKRDPVAFLSERSVDRMLCIGWRYLIPRSALALLGHKVVVAHDSLLPQLRGFAPLVTAMILGHNRTGVTFLTAGSGVDDGDILWQSSVAITDSDTIEILIDKLVPLYIEGSMRFLRGDFGPAQPQDHDAATYSIWRDEEDYWIDWSQPAERIERTVRALGPPYLGARTRIGDEVIILRAVQKQPDLEFVLRQPGKIWTLDADGHPSVICGQGMLRIDSAELLSGAPFVAQRLRQRFC